MEITYGIRVPEAREERQGLSGARERICASIDGRPDEPPTPGNSRPFDPARKDDTMPREDCEPRDTVDLRVEGSPLRRSWIHTGSGVAYSGPLETISLGRGTPGFYGPRA